MHVFEVVRDSPSYRAVQLPGLYVVRWKAAMRREWMQFVIEDVTRLARTGPVVYAGISDDRADAPEPTMLIDLVRGSIDIARKAEQFHLIVLGSSLGATLTRSMFRGMLSSARLGKAVLDFTERELAKKYFIHGSLDAFVEAADVELSPSELHVALERAGMLSGL